MNMNVMDEQAEKYDPLGTLEAALASNITEEERLQLPNQAWPRIIRDARIEPDLRSRGLANKRFAIGSGDMFGSWELDEAYGAWIEDEQAKMDQLLAAKGQRLWIAGEMDYSPVAIEASRLFFEALYYGADSDKLPKASTTAISDSNLEFFEQNRAKYDAITENLPPTNPRLTEILRAAVAERVSGDWLRQEASRQPGEPIRQPRTYLLTLQQEAQWYSWLREQQYTTNWSREGLPKTEGWVRLFNIAPQAEIQAIVLFLEELSKNPRRPQDWRY